MTTPLRRFALLGALLFGLDLAASAAPPSPGAASPQGAGPPDAELLFREALARGYHERDGVVRRRLARNLRFALSLPEARSPAEEAARVEEALALGLHESDLVVRRRLVQKMELLAQEKARLEEPTEAELARWRRRHADRYRVPPRVALTQVHFRRREEAEAAAGRARASAAAHADAPLAGIAGDPFPLPRELPLHTEAELAARLGPDLADAALALEAGAWSGPVRSAYGWHLLHARVRREAYLPPLDAIRARVRDALLAERAAQHRAALVARLRSRGGS